MPPISEKNVLITGNQSIVMGIASDEAIVIFYSADPGYVSLGKRVVASINQEAEAAQLLGNALGYYLGIGDVNIKAFFGKNIDAELKSTVEGFLKSPYKVRGVERVITSVEVIKDDNQSINYQNVQLKSVVSDHKPAKKPSNLANIFGIRELKLW